jgi:hypothetical protein
MEELPPTASPIPPSICNRVVSVATKDYGDHNNKSHGKSVALDLPLVLVLLEVLTTT